MNYEPGILNPGTMEPGKTIYFLGTAKYGPIYEPVLVNNENDAIRIFGSPYESPLTKAFMMFQQSGGEEAFLFRITGNNAKVELYGPSGVVVEFYAQNAGVIGNTFRISVFQDKLSFSYSNNGQAITSEYFYEEYDTVGYLCKTINQTIGNVIEAVAIEPSFVTANLPQYNITYNSFNGGDDGLDVTKNELYYGLETALNLLEGKHIDLIVPVGMYVDDVQPLHYITDPSYGDMYYVADRDYLDIDLDNGEKAGYHKLLISFARKQLFLGTFTHIIMGMNPIPKTFPAGYSHTFKIAQASPVGRQDGFRLWSYNNWYDVGHYVSVCYGDCKYFKDTGLETIDNWYITYAAIWIRSGYGESTTGMSIQGVETVQDFEDVLEDLATLGIVTYRYSPVKGWCVAAGVTQALPTNPFYYAPNIKIVQRTLSKLYEDIMIFKDNDDTPVITRTTLSKVIERSIDQRKNIEKIITDYDYTITVDPNTDIIYIELWLYTPFTMEAIVTTSRATIRMG